MMIVPTVERGDDRRSPKSVTCRWIILLILLFAGCSTLHPRQNENFVDKCKSFKKIAVLPPYFKVGVKYYDTSVYIYSPQKSKALSSGLLKEMQNILSEKGYLATVRQNDLQQNISWEEVKQLLMDKQYETSMPFGMPREPTRLQGDLRYMKQMIEAEKVFDRIILSDPGYKSETLPADLFFNGPYDDLTEYDLIFIVYGAMRCETDSEYYTRWSKNIGLNLLTLPLSIIATIMPFAVPFATSTPTFFSGSPDVSWIALIAFEPQTGQVIFMNDYFFEGMVLESGVMKGAGKLLDPIPAKESF